MEKEKIIMLAQLLTGIKDAIVKLEGALKSKDLEMASAAKKEILSFQGQIDKIL